MNILAPRSTSHYTHLQQLCSSLSLRNVVTEPTRFPSGTCLDVVLINKRLAVSKSNVVSQSGISDHELVVVEVDIPDIVLPSSHRFKCTRKPGLSSVNYTECVKDLTDALRTRSPHGDLHRRACTWTETINGIMNLYAPPTRVVVPSVKKPKPQPWVNAQLRYLLHQRKHLHTKVKKDPDNSRLLQKYRQVRREGTLLNRRLKSQHCEAAFVKLKRNPRAQWALINKLTGRQKLRADPKADVIELSTTFADVVTETHSHHQPVMPLPTSSSESAVLDTFETTSVPVVKQMLETLNIVKSPGSDNIPPLFLRRCADVLAPSLTNIINSSLTTGVVPDSYKLANICPVYKSGAHTDPKNYRPISLLPIVSKVLERIVHQRLVNFFDENPDCGALPKEQFAYRHHHSCEDALTLAINRWNNDLDSGMKCGVVFADLSKAFDRVRHVELLQGLANVGIRGTALTWFESYLKGRRQQVKVSDKYGEQYLCTRGVPQGSVLGPLLFCVYIRNVPSVFSRSKCQIYADDICFYYPSYNLSDITTVLSRELEILYDWLEDHGLLLNPKKTQFLMLHRSTQEIPPNLVIHCKTIPIAAVNSAKYLGIHIDDVLSFQKQVLAVVKK